MKTVLIGLLMSVTIAGALGEEKRAEPPPPSHYDSWPQRYYDENGYLEYNPRTNSYEYHPGGKKAVKKEKKEPPKGLRSTHRSGVS